MSNGEIQYIADTLLIEKVAKFDSVITKEAGLVDEVFSGVGSAVSSYVKNNIDFSSPAATSKSVLKILAPGMLFRVHPLLAFLYYIGNEYGYDIVGTIESIVSSISDKIKSGQPVSPEEINQAALSKTSSLNSDLFYGLRELEKSGSILKAARRGAPVGGPMFGSRKNSILMNLFGFLDRRSRGSAKSLFAGFIAWFIKTILLSAGLLAVGAGAKKVIEKGKDAVTGDQPGKEEQDLQQKSDKLEKPEKDDTAQKTQPVDHKEKQQESSSDSSWYLPVLGGSVEKTLLDWAKEFYPDLSGYEDIILKTPSFNSAVRDLSKTRSGSYLVMPGSFDRKSAVDRFIRDVDREINKLKRQNNENA